MTLDELRIEILKLVDSKTPFRQIPKEIRTAIFAETSFFPLDSALRYRISYIVNNTCHVDDCNNQVIIGSRGRPHTTCSVACRAKLQEQKRKDTCLERYGVTNTSKLPSSQQKRKDTCLERFGVEHNFSSPTIREKIKKTNLERYGAENPMHSNICKEKLKETNLERYGVENVFAHKDKRQKRKDTMILKYGKEHPIQNLDIKKKIEDTCIEKYGAKSPLESTIITDKIRETNNKRYGGDSPFNSADVMDKSKNTCLSRYGTENFSHQHISTDIIEKYTDKEWLIDQIKTKSVRTLSKELNVSTFAIATQLKKYDLRATRGVSGFETEVYDFVKSLMPEDTVVSFADRSLLQPKEIDIYVPSKNLAIECNGIYWHSELQGKDRNYHLNKTKLCAEQGIQLVHIWDNDWDNKQETVKNRLRIKLGLCDKIFARKTELRSITPATTSCFLDTYHIQGTCQSFARYGLYYENELVAVMTFGKPRYKKDVEWELLRFCSNKQVLGGASKLFKAFIDDYSPKTIISYSDKMWNTGGVYKVLGFEHIRTSKPSYYYTQKYHLLENRVKYQKHKLKEKLENFDASLSEWQNMQNNGYDRIWDCGTDVWFYNK